MEKFCKCVNIQYEPRVFTGEVINVGVVFHNVDDNQLYYREIRKTSRIKAFDDELEISEFKKNMKYIKDFLLRPVRENLLDKKQTLDEDYLENSSRMLLNKYKLSNIMTLYSHDPEKDFDDFCNEILYYDLDKTKRPTNEQSALLMNKIIYSAIKYKSFEFTRKPLLSETYGEDVKCDFKVDNTYFKAFNLSANNYNYKYNNAKTWVYNSRYFNDNNQKLVFVLSSRPTSNEEKIIIKILKDSDLEILYMDQLNTYFDKNFTQKAA